MCNNSWYHKSIHIEEHGDSAIRVYIYIYALLCTLRCIAPCITLYLALLCTLHYIAPCVTSYPALLDTLHYIVPCVPQYSALLCTQRYSISCVTPYHALLYAQRYSISCVILCRALLWTLRYSVPCVTLFPSWICPLRYFLSCVSLYHVKLSMFYSVPYSTPCPWRSDALLRVRCALWWREICRLQLEYAIRPAVEAVALHPATLISASQCCIGKWHLLWPRWYPSHNIVAMSGVYCGHTSIFHWFFTYK